MLPPPPDRELIVQPTKPNTNKRAEIITDEGSTIFRLNPCELTPTTLERVDTAQLAALSALENLPVEAGAAHQRREQPD
jgi:hypothetical protein